VVTGSNPVAPTNTFWKLQGAGEEPAPSLCPRLCPRLTLPSTEDSAENHPPDAIVKRLCIFCAGGPTTAEHWLAHWIHDLLGPSTVELWRPYVSSTTRVGKGSAPIASATSRNRLEWSTPVLLTRRTVGRPYRPGCASRRPSPRNPAIPVEGVGDLGGIMGEY
jgi:hypothetical protein